MDLFLSDYENNIRSFQVSNLINSKTAFWLGISGILGGLILFAGDMLFYYNGDETDYMVNLANSSDQRIIASGVTALLAAWLYTLASGQIYYAFQPAKKWIRLSVFFSLAAIMITYGVVHGAFVAIAVAAKNAAQLGMPANSMVELAIAANDALRNIAYLPFAIFIVLFIPTVWKGHTHFPRWIILFCPIVPYLFQGIIVPMLTGKWVIIVGGGYLNLILVLFFSATTIALRSSK